MGTTSARLPSSRPRSARPRAPAHDRVVRTWAAALGAMALAIAGHAAAASGIPPAYAPLVVEPNVRNGRTEFDLTAARDRARSAGKRLYVYLGARDCPYCRAYEMFLARNAAELVPHFARDYLVVDLRSALSVQGDTLYFKVDATSLGYKAFMQRIGDERARLLVYPSVWLFDGQLKPLMQMPAGTGTFQTVAEQLEILRLEQ